MARLLGSMPPPAAFGGGNIFSSIAAKRFCQGAGLHFFGFFLYASFVPYLASFLTSGRHKPAGKRTSQLMSTFRLAHRVWADLSCCGGRSFRDKIVEHSYVYSLPTEVGEP